MSSKIIKRAQPGVCQPFNWPVLGSGLSQPAAPRSHEDDSRSPALREQQIERLAVAIARRVLRRELTVDPQAIQGLLKAALAQIQVQEVNRVRVHPEHEAAVRACLARCGSGTRIEVVGDTDL